MNFILSYFASESSLLITKLRFQIRLTFFSLPVPLPPFPSPALMQGYLYFTFVFRTLKPFLWSTSIAFYLSMLLPSFLSKYFHGIWPNRSFQIWRFPPSLSYCSFHSPIYLFSWLCAPPRLLLFVQVVQLFEYHCDAFLGLCSHFSQCFGVLYKLSV